MLPPPEIRAYRIYKSFLTASLETFVNYDSWLFDMVETNYTAASPNQIIARNRLVDHQ